MSIIEALQLNEVMTMRTNSPTITSIIVIIYLVFRNIFKYSIVQSFSILVHITLINTIRLIKKMLNKALIKNAQTSPAHPGLSST